MKILQVITLTELGGAQMVLASLANTLCAEHEVVVANIRYESKTDAAKDSYSRRSTHNCKQCRRTTRENQLSILTSCFLNMNTSQRSQRDVQRKPRIMISRRWSMNMKRSICD